jgi:hypothetical protein
MLKFLIGPVLVGSGYAAGSYYGADAEQIVHKSPSLTYAGVEEALAGVSESGTTSFDGGTPMLYALSIDRTLDQQLVVRLSFAGRSGAEADLTFTPQNGGADTLVRARIHGERDVLQAALAGTSRAKLAYAPDWMLNLAFRPLLQQLAGQIEEGRHADLGLTPGEAEAQWESNLSDEQRSGLAAWRQYDATRPAVDPNADAERSRAGGGSDS